MLEHMLGLAAHILDEVEAIELEHGSSVGYTFMGANLSMLRCIAETIIKSMSPKG